MKHKAM